LCEFLAGRSQDDAARVRRGFQECGADGLFEVVDLTSEAAFLTPRCLAAWLRLGARVRFADGPLPCEGEVGIRRVPEPAEYATLSPEHEDYPRAQIAHR
jgi:hypothetical protein